MTRKVTQLRLYAAREKLIQDCLKENPEGLTASVIAAKTLLDFKVVVSILNELQEYGKSKVIGSSRGYGKKWVAGNNESIVTGGAPLYPNFDEEHKEWVKLVTRKKVIYNPR